MNTSVAFIILNYKTFEDTIILGKEILDSSIPNSVIVIVDNCSPNESYQKLLDAFKDEKTVDVIASPMNGGYAKGNNFGLRFVKKYSPEYVCIINNDVHFSADTISQLINDVETNENVGAIAPKQLLPDGKDIALAFMNCVSFKEDLRGFVLTLPPPPVKYKATSDDGRLMKVGFVPGAFVFMKYSIVEKIGFFDESTFLYSEERFLSKRLEQIGYGCFIDIKTSYVHAHSKTIKGTIDYKKNRLLMLQSRRLFIEKYYKHGKMKSIVLGVLATAVINVKSLYHK